MKKLVLIGGGGHCKACIDVIESEKKYEIIGILEKDNLTSDILGYPVIGTDDLIDQLVQKGYEFLVTVGQIKSPNLRIKLADRVRACGGKLANVIASTAYISAYSKIEEGTIIMHNVFVNAGVEIGSNCIINTGSILEHDVKVGSNCHISVGAILNGEVEVGDNSFVGSNTVCYQGIKIMENSLIGAGSIVHKTLRKSGVYLGFPLKKIS